MSHESSERPLYVNSGKSAICVSSQISSRVSSVFTLENLSESAPKAIINSRTSKTGNQIITQIITLMGESNMSGIIHLFFIPFLRINIAQSGGITAHNRNHFKKFMNCCNFGFCIVVSFLKNILLLQYYRINVLTIISIQIINYCGLFDGRVRNDVVDL